MTDAEQKYYALLKMRFDDVYRIGAVFRSFCRVGVSRGTNSAFAVFDVVRFHAADYMPLWLSVVASMAP